MLSSFQLSVQIFLQVMESFLCLENRFQLCLLRCLPIAVRLGVQCPGVCSPLLMTHLCLFTCLVNLSRVFFSGAAVQFLTISGFSTLFSFMFSVWRSLMAPSFYRPLHLPFHSSYSFITTSLIPAEMILSCILIQYIIKAFVGIALFLLDYVLI